MRFERRIGSKGELQLDEVIMSVEMTMATAVSDLKYRIDYEE
jgi:hypothetical protein